MLTEGSFLVGIDGLGPLKIDRVMKDALTQEDWERISYALSHFGHNASFNETLEKVKAILKRASAE